MIPFISILIPTFNGSGILPETIRAAIIAGKNSGCGFEIIVSDDASTDNTPVNIRKEFPGLKIITAEINCGFAVTANKGIKSASGDFVLLLNSDTLLSENYFNTQFSFFEDKNTFGVMGRICEPGSERTIDAAKYPSWNGSRLISTGNFMVANTPPGFIIPTLFLSGANALMDRKKIFTLGGFNEIYSPFYMEDVDLGVRAWRLGWKCCYDPEAVCYHNPSSTIKKYYNNRFIRQISKRNKMIFHFIHLAGVRRILWITETVLNLIFRWMILDAGYYRSFYGFSGLCTESLRNKRQFGKIQKEMGVALSVENITTSIRKQIQKFTITRF
ncbi:MAG: glycosyltransferase [Bacteroidetes bacterium]|nr:glycosyltransferase [Bacteroidota bacterium]